MVDPVAILLLVLDEYIIPYLPTLVIVLAAVGLASWLGGRRGVKGQRRALRQELFENLEQARSILEFVDTQGKGAPYDIPIPRFHTAAYEQLRNSGNLSTLRRGVREQVMTVYSAIDRVELASDRQEELLLGVAATSPVALEVRAQNLAFIKDTVSNMILTRLEQFETFTRI